MSRSSPPECSPRKTLSKQKANPQENNRVEGPSQCIHILHKRGHKSEHIR